MAAWPSLHMEERNLLRRREWERRSQEAQQQQEQYQENAPLFGEPIKTNKGDELSSRIQRMLGCYEDMKDLHKSFGSLPKDLSAPVPFGRPGRPTHSDTSKPPFQNPPPSYGDSQVAPASLSASQPSKKPPAPDHTLLTSGYSHPSVDHAKGSPEPQDRESEPWPDMRDCASLPPVLSALSPPSDPLSPLHSSDPSDSEQHDAYGKDSPGPRQPLQGPSGPPTTVETFHAGAEMEGIPLASETAPLPFQTFPLPLSSKPSLVMPPKPTAYVRPMDGQDQVTSESPELKPSPDFDRQSYESLPDLKSSSKSGLTQLKVPPPSLEALSSDAQCVEAILREMTHTWPPLLTAIHTPSTADPPKFSFPNKETQHGHSGVLVQKHEAWRGSSPPPPVLSCQQEPPVVQARCSGGETASSSESESSSGSESDSESSESGGEELEEAPPPHITSPPPPAKADGPAVNEWQLGRWLELKEPQPSLSVETQGDALHSSPSSPASSPKLQEETNTPQHYNSHSSPAQPESASPAQYSYRSQSPPIQPETTTPTHFNYDSHSSPVRTEPSTPPHYNYNSHSSPVRSETTTPAHYNYSSHTSPAQPEVKDSESKPSGPNRHIRSQSPSPSIDVDNGPRKMVGNKKPSSSRKAQRQEDDLRHVDSKELAPHQKDPSLTDRPKVKTKTDPAKGQTKVSSKADKKAARQAAKQAAKHTLSDKKKAKEVAPKVTVKLSLPKEVDQDTLPQALPPPQPTPSVKSRGSNLGDGLPKSKKKKKKKTTREHSPAQGNKRSAPAKATQEAPRTLLVKIHLSLLSTVPTLPSVPKAARVTAGGSAKPVEKKAEREEAAPAKASKKRSAEKEDKSQPRKKLKLDKESKRPSSPISSSSSAPPCPGSGKSEGPKTVPEEKEKERKKKKKPPSCSTQAPAAQEPMKGAGHKRPLADAPEAKASSQTSGAPAKHKKSSSKHSEHTKTGKKSPKSSFAEPAQPKRTPAPHRVLLKVDDRQYSVEHHMKEAKKLKHKADAMSEKVGKSFFYLEAALSFVESGIAMETDPQTPKSAYTMFSETVDLIRFILKLRSYSDPASPASEKDFAVLCMRFQSLLQMAMFRYKREAALRYSRTLTDHFKSCKTSPSPRFSKSTNTPSQMSPMASPASVSSSSGPASSQSSGTAPANTVALPQTIHQVASTYVSITALFLSAHSIWEQAEEMSQKGSGVLLELDSAIGLLTLLSSMSSVVCYTRQGLHWLRQDSLQRR